MSNFTIVDLLNQSPNVIITGGLNPTGAYNLATTYSKGDSVSYNGGSYVAITATTGNTPSNTTFWQVISGAFSTGTSDANFTQSFTAVSSVVVIHNLGKYPSAYVTDSAHDECEGEIIHNSVNQLTVIFSAAFTGTIVCN